MQEDNKKNLKDPTQNKNTPHALDKFSDFLTKTYNQEEKRISSSDKIDLRMQAIHALNLKASLKKYEQNPDLFDVFDHEQLTMNISEFIASYLSKTQSKEYKKYYNLTHQILTDALNQSFAGKTKTEDQRNHVETYFFILAASLSLKEQKAMKATENDACISKAIRLTSNILRANKCKLKSVKSLNNLFYGNKKGFAIGEYTTLHDLLIYERINIMRFIQRHSQLQQKNMLSDKEYNEIVNVFKYLTDKLEKSASTLLQKGLLTLTNSCE